VTADFVVPCRRLTNAATGRAWVGAAGFVGHDEGGWQYQVMTALREKHRLLDITLRDYLSNLQQLVEEHCSEMGRLPWQDFFTLLDAAFTGPVGWARDGRALVGSDAPQAPL
jgi:hypothetical protein